MGQQQFDENVPMYPEVDPLSGDCYIPSKKCNAAVLFAKNTGIKTHPSWYARSGLTSASTLGEFQNYLYKNQPDESGCVPYCDSGANHEKEAAAQTKTFDRRLGDVQGEDLSKLIKKLFLRVNMTKVHHDVLSKAFRMNGVIAAAVKKAQRA